MNIYRDLLSYKPHLIFCNKDPPNIFDSPLLIPHAFSQGRLIFARQQLRFLDPPPSPL